MRVEGITHVALELSSPTRMERYLRDAYGLQLLREGYLRGEYVRVIGSPFDQTRNPGLLLLYNRPFIPRGRLRHVAFAVADMGVEAAVAELRSRGHYDIDGEDVIQGPAGLRIKLDSFERPRPLPVDEAGTRLKAAQVDPALPCLVRGVHHVALDVGDQGAILDWQGEVFGFDHRRHHDRRGEKISQIYYGDAPTDGIGRRMSLLPLFERAGAAAELNHIAFVVDDCLAAIEILEGRGVHVDLPADAIVQGPEEVWTQLDSRARPIPVGHPANDPGVTLVDYHNR